MHMYALCRCAAFAVACAFSGGIALGTTINLDVRALGGEAAPGAATGVLFRAFGNAVINDAGQVAFLGQMTGNGVDTTNDQGVWSDVSGLLGLVAREGGSAAGTAAGVMFDVVGAPALNDSGYTSFRAVLRGPGVVVANKFGLWSEDSGVLAPAARDGDPAPDMPDGVVFSSLLSAPVMNGADQIAFFGGVAGPGVDLSNSNAIWSGTTGGLQLVARNGDHAPGTQNGVVFDGISFPVINGSGQTAFASTITGPGVNFSNRYGIWSEGTGVLRLVARSGQPAPGAGPGVMYQNFVYYPVINDAGETAYIGHMTGTGITNANDEAIWSEGGGALHMVVREGDSVPGAEPGTVFNSLINSSGYPVINKQGRTAFRGALSGPAVDGANDTGLWIEDSGSLQLIARSGDPAPGVPDGVVFGGSSGGAFRAPVLNGFGQIAFIGTLAGPGIDSNNDTGLWATDRYGVLTLIAREGTQIDINDDPLVQELRTIRSLGLVTNSGGEDGRPTSFNDAGQIVFDVYFTDGRGAVLVATVPEPQTAAVLSVGFIFMLRRRKAMSSCPQDHGQSDL